MAIRIEGRRIETVERRPPREDGLNKRWLFFSNAENAATAKQSHHALGGV